jgi:hypothetical protein
VVFILVALVVANGADECDAFEEEEGSMLKLKDASLFPYMGESDLPTSINVPDVATCITTCLANNKCIGFYHHNNKGRTEDQKICKFYSTNNVKNLVGEGVELTNFFNTTSQIRVGPELPEHSTDVYIKKGQTFRQIRSGIEKPSVAV